MTSKLDEISEAIGGLRTEVATLRHDFTDSTKRADEHRASIHKRVDDLVHDFGDLNKNVETMKADVADSKESPTRLRNGNSAGSVRFSWQA